jgi:glucose/arabinose dehydrogenase
MAVTTSLLVAVSLVRAFPRLAFVRPLDLQADHAGHLCVVEQRGTIRRFAEVPDPAAAAPYLDLRDRVTAAENEEGLLGLAFDPDFKRNRAFYVNYTAPHPLRTVISRFHEVNGKGDARTEEVLLTFRQPYENHNGGCLQFGPDGYLYVGTGDGGSGGDPQHNGQNRKVLLGKMLRLDVRRPGRYAIPPDNPYAGNRNGWRPEIWAYGLRNPWRYSFDAQTGLLYCADVGQNRVEEVDIIKRGGNYGWSVMEGSECFQAASCNQKGLELPIAEYHHDAGQSITGGYVYRGPGVPGLQGAYVYADFVSGKVWQLRYAGGKVQARGLLLESHLNISSFGQGSDRELYATAFDGHVYRFR